MKLKIHVTFSTVGVQASMAFEELYNLSDFKCVGNWLLSATIVIITVVFLNATRSKTCVKFSVKLKDFTNISVTLSQSYYRLHIFVSSIAIS